MAKKTLVNAETDRDVNEFIETVSNKRRKEDALNYYIRQKFHESNIPINF